MLIDHKYKVDISQPMVPRYLPESLFYSDKKADRFIISLADGLESVTAFGVVTAYFVREATAETVILTDAGITDGKLYAILDSACYAKPGRCALVIQLDYNNSKKTCFMGHMKVVPTLTDVYVDPGYVVGNVSDLIAQATHLYEELEVALNDAYEYSTTISDLISSLQSQIHDLAATSIHHYIQKEEPTENLMNGDLWTYKDLNTWGGIASDDQTWEDLSESTWGQLVNAGETGYTKTYLNGMWLIMSSVDVDNLESAENENF